jgi:quercetin dioxygenase-like cupin family protein
LEVIKMAEKMQAPGCIGTVVEVLAQNAQRQVMRVTVDPNGSIPLHTHENPADMYIVRGSARALGKSREVSPGDFVSKGTGEPHGFEAYGDGLEFISTSYGPGIYQGGVWDINFQ